MKYIKKIYYILYLSYIITFSNQTQFKKSWNIIITFFFFFGNNGGNRPEMVAKERRTMVKTDNGPTGEDSVAALDCTVLIFLVSVYLLNALKFSNNEFTFVSFMCQWIENAWNLSPLKARCMCCLHIASKLT